MHIPPIQTSFNPLFHYSNFEVNLLCVYNISVIYSFLNTYTFVCAFFLRPPLSPLLRFLISAQCQRYLSAAKQNNASSADPNALMISLSTVPSLQPLFFTPIPSRIRRSCKKHLSAPVPVHIFKLFGYRLIT